ncbi:TAP-like protein-domain-containing protein [Stachybotrys elegans]|uniref:TAP-like protein-domain-containing protein n=1 Tax=Stachybotrys elegans TaxID=80388 RepID=A0A8K0SZL1_9HYPO|nr:TAP-like protein-domain-containing protein [Stachybotrys elegans]
MHRPPATALLVALTTLVSAFSWPSITPSSSITWHSCYEAQYQCARLLLPLDYLDTAEASSNSTLAIAIIKLPAQVPYSSPAYAGPIFTNPGGPGGSGVAFLRRFGPYLQRVVDVPGTRHYDILSFDPRGIGESTPRVDCFPGGALARTALALEVRGTWGLDRGEDALRHNRAATEAYTARCAQAEDTAAVLPFVGTASVARDIVEMADKLDEERRAALAAQEDRHRLELKRDVEGPVRVQYIGFSYGTVLGHYLAALFPGRLGRIVLDGVCDVDDFATGPGWLSNLKDTDEIFTQFLHGCHIAGPSICSLSREGDTSVSSIQSRVTAFFEALEDRPSHVLHPDGSSAIISAHDVRALLGSMMYQPLNMFRPYADILSAAMDGNMTLLASRLADGGVLPSLATSCPIPDSGNGEPGSDGGHIEGMHAVVCGDGDDVTDKDLSWWSDYVHKQTSMSSIFGAFWSAYRFACSSWPVQTRWSYKGPFTTPPADASLLPDRPAAPILFLSNRLDPVTPLANARSMAANHPGAAVVIQEALGHCALASTRSRCVAQIVSQYFENGTVPDHEVSCEAECGPWDHGCTLFDSYDTEFDASASRLLRQDRDSLRLPLHPLGIL